MISQTNKPDIVQQNKIHFYPLIILVNSLSIIIFGWEIEGRHHKNS